MIARRLGPAPDAARCGGGHNCPDLFELVTGDFAVIGTDVTEQLAGMLPPGSGCGPGERIVSVPRRTLVLARNDIPAVV